MVGMKCWHVGGVQQVVGYTKVASWLCQSPLLLCSGYCPLKVEDGKEDNTE